MPPEITLIDWELYESSKGRIWLRRTVAMHDRKRDLRFEYESMTYAVLGYDGLAGSIRTYCCPQSYQRRRTPTMHLQEEGTRAWQWTVRGLGSMWSCRAEHSRASTRDIAQALSPKRETGRAWPAATTGEKRKITALSPQSGERSAITCFPKSSL